jgi:C1A family cysteine protease
MFGALDYLYSLIYGVTEKPIVVDNFINNTKTETKTETNTETNESNLLINTIKKKYGWKKGEAYTITPKHIFKLLDNIANIQNVDLRSDCPDVYDQGHLGSCTANAIGFCYHYDEIKQKEKSAFIPSRLFIYYNERNLEGHVTEDSGAEIHDGIQVIHSLGVCSETDWPYNIDKFKDKPTDNCYSFALSHKTIDYRAISQNLDQLKSALIEGFPVVFGFSVYESFESEEVAKTGYMPMPKPNEKILGGHAVTIVGFDNSKKIFIVRNSWGSGWGDKGYFYMPYDFIVNPNMASDFWTITKTIDEQETDISLKNKVSDSHKNTLKVENNDLILKKQTLEDHIKTKIIYDKILFNNKMSFNLTNYKENSDLIVVSKRNRKLKLKDL